jgi:hypothetical protein
VNPKADAFLNGAKSSSRPGAVAGLGGALAVLLATATLGEGGATPPVTLWIHTGVVVILGVLLLLPERPGESLRRVPAGLRGATLVFAALTLVGAAVAPYRYAAVTTLLEVGVFLAVAWVAARNGPSLSRILSTPLLIAAALQGGLAIFQHFHDGTARPAGTFLNPSHLAGWLVAALFVGLGPVALGRSAGAVVWRSVVAVPAIVAVCLAGSRGALLGLAAGAAWLVASVWKRLGPRARTALLAASMAGVILAAVGVVVRSASLDPFRYQRLRIWEASLAVTWDRPWLGVGPGQWDAAANNVSFPLQAGPLRFERYVDSTHSDALRLPAELGWPAALAALLALALAVREIRRGRRDGRLDVSTAGATAALVALGVQALVDNLSARPAVYLLAAALLGALASVPGRRAAERAATPWRVGAAALLLFGLVVADGSPFVAWRLQQALPRGRLDAGQRLILEAALERNPLHPDLWLRAARDFAGDGSDWSLDDYATAREAAETATRLQPADARYALGLARLEGLAFGTLFGDVASRERAARRYRDAQELARHDPGIALEEGEFLLRAADPLGARRAAERALAIEPNSVPARLLLAEAILSAGAPGARERAAAIVDEADAIAQQWRDYPRVSDYARFHLALDARRVERIRGRIGSTEGTPEDAS